jgi:PAS domain S-box-containing protein
VTSDSNPYGLSCETLFAVVENLPYATGLFGPDLSYIYYNRAGEVMSGIPLNQALGRKPNDLLPQQLCDTFVPLVQLAIDSKLSVKRDIQVSFGADIITLRLNYVPILDANKNVTCVLGITEDITVPQFVKNQMNLAESISESGSWYYRISNNEFWVSDQAANVLGLDRNLKFSLESFLESFEINSRDFLKETIEQTILNAESFDQEFTLKERTNSERFLRIIGRPNQFTGKVQSISGALQDITVSKNQEIGLQRALARANFSNQAKSDFLSNVSHEIRTPLTAIAGFSELICTPGTLSHTELINIKERIRTNVIRLTGIIDSILDLAKIEYSKTPSERSRIRLKKLVAETEALASRRGHIKNLVVSVSCNAEPTQIITIEYAKTISILEILIENSAKFTRTGSIFVQFSTHENYEGGRNLIVNVEDTGQGISLDQQKSLFDPFHQGDSSSTKMHGGLGVGLALARKLARQQNGDLTLVWSEPDKGSHFQLVLRDVSSLNSR